MSTRLFNTKGYGHLYRSLLRFCEIGDNEAMELVYLLNTANLDSYTYGKQGRRIAESDPVRFIQSLSKDYRPYHTEVQLYKAMAALDMSIAYGAVTEAQREAVKHMRSMMRKLELVFSENYGMAITDLRTVYNLCTFDLAPHEDEPSVCLMRDLG